ncbi:hypothetical protein SAM46_00485 [Mycoplasmopsis verecunda]|uniref:hypothetical protein n=1 Tax=Mycoplasmopsis verecunda TaxID=171291 RepID=UPI00298D3B1F|nr:hypothetical protein [Mycoplasmopsis verecunda]WPB54632.1 hypothetical protein SAM46_00485 [Mycoplasmopsis verecunda]
MYNGFTIYSEVNKHITSGFIVAIKNIYKKKIKLQNISLDETDALLIIINEIVRNYNCEIGLWYDEVNSIIYIDEIIILNDINKAIKIASKNNQEVICDLQNQIEIII